MVYPDAARVIRDALGIIVLLALLVGMAWAWAAYNALPGAPVGEAVVGTAAPEIKNLYAVDLPPTKKPIKGYTGEKAKKKFNLPAAVISNPAMVVMAPVKIKADNVGHSHTAVPTLNTETGAVETYVRTDPLPWFEFKTSGSAGVYGGVTTDMGPVVRAIVQQDIIQVKRLKLGVMASVDQPTGMQPTGTAGITDFTGPRGFVGLGGKVEW